MKRYQQRVSVSGFTLVELMVVIAIVATLIALLFPSLESARYRAKKVVCVSNLRQISQVMITMAMDRKGAFPVNVHTYPSALKTSTPGWTPHLWDAMQYYVIPQIGGNQMLACPVTHPDTSFLDTYTDPAGCTYSPYYRRYGGYNAGALSVSYGVTEWLSTSYAFPAGFQAPSGTPQPSPISGEARWPKWLSDSSASAPMVFHQILDGGGDGGHKPVGPRTTAPPTCESSTVGFADGHAELRNTGELKYRQAINYSSAWHQMWY